MTENRLSHENDYCKHHNYTCFKTFIYYARLSSRFRVNLASVTSELQTVLKRAYFMTLINGVFCVRRVCDKQMRDAFQSSRLIGVRLWTFLAL